MEMQDFNLYELSRDYGEVPFVFWEAYDIGREYMEKFVARIGGSEHK